MEPESTETPAAEPSEESKAVVASPEKFEPPSDLLRSSKFEAEIGNEPKIAQPEKDQSITVPFEGVFINQPWVQRLESMQKSQKFLAQQSKSEITTVTIVDPNLQKVATGAKVVPPKSLEQQVKVLLTDSLGMCYLYEYRQRSKDFLLLKQAQVSRYDITAAVQINIFEMRGNTPFYESQDCFALAALNNDIHIYGFVAGKMKEGKLMYSFYAHDALITCLLYHDYKLISISDDQTIKVWDLKAP